MDEVNKSSQNVVNSEELTVIPTSYVVYSYML